MAEFPALPLWTDAYIADTQHLTNEEHGVYLRLLMFAWRSPSCSLVDDDRRLAIMVGVTPKVWARLKPEVMSFWTLTDGHWTQKKLTSQRDFVKANRKQKSAAGKASAKAKALKNKDRGSTAVSTDDATKSQRGGNNHTHTHIQENTSYSLEGTRISDDWALTDELRNFACTKGLSDEQITNEAEKFKNYWLAASGSNAVKRDWFATWRNWIIMAAERAGGQSARGGGNAAQRSPMQGMVAGFEQAAFEGAERDRRERGE